MLVKALSGYIGPAEKNKKAWDIGAGAGNETNYLIEQGYEVWALDPTLASMDYIKERVPKDKQNKLHLVQKKLEDLNWRELPEFDLVFSVSALPFIHPDKFDAAWKKIVKKLKPEGYFVGSFFGDKFRGFDEKDVPNMTWLTKEQVKELFSDFKVKFFREVDRPGESATGVKHHSHVFRVIAKKR